MSKLILGVAGGMLMVCLMSDSQAAEAENAFVKVVGESRVYRLEQKGEKDFNAYCGGVAPATFSVAAQQPDWVLVRPASGSLAITPGTSGVWKVKSQLGEDKPDGRIYLWNYHIKAEGYNAKDITVPYGKTVKYFSYEGPTMVNSDWTVNTISKNNYQGIDFTRTFWGSINWFTFPSLTPNPGVYQIRANLHGKPTITDNGKMTVVNTDFKESVDHQYGFDDYSAWNLGPSDYYGDKKGRCTWPYASIKSGSYGISELAVFPIQNSKEIPIKSSIEQLTCEPQSVNATSDIQFHSVSTSQIPLDGYLKTELDGIELSRLNVTSYKEKTHKCLIVAVSENPSCEFPDNTRFQQLYNDVYRQAVLLIYCSTARYTKSSWPEVWTEDDMHALGNEFVAQLGEAAQYNSYVFLLPGISWEGKQYLGYGGMLGNYCFLFSEIESSPMVPSHELGHNLGLDDLYRKTNGVYVAGTDLKNLMNMGGAVAQYKLRKQQWDAIHKNRK
jgi:hypothetical protein